MRDAVVIGAGLAGCEAAWQLANRGICVTLYEMKPTEKSAAHKSDNFCELVCSNSLRSNELTNACGLLKQELRELRSLVVECADENAVDAGGALAVDRDKFSLAVTDKIKNHPNVKICYEKLEKIPRDCNVIVATGPLTDGALAEDIEQLCGGDALHFYDAAAPIVSFESIDMSRAFFASRYGKGTGVDYINCPMNEAEYKLFVAELASAQEADVHGFEDKKVFEGCMPAEVVARRGEDTLRFGAMKPIGLDNPQTDEKYYAVAQLRRENAAGTMYNLVGFQTHLKFPEQKRVFSMLPGLERAEFLRYGVMHRNSYINSPSVLDEFYRLKSDNRVMFAGQMTGVEGYVESVASGFACGVNMARSLLGDQPVSFGSTTAIGSLAIHISQGGNTKNFQPMNINFGLIESLDHRVRGKKERYTEVSERALAHIKSLQNDILHDWENI